LGVPKGASVIKNPEKWLLEQLSPNITSPTSIQKIEDSSKRIQRMIEEPKSVKKMARKERKKTSKMDNINLFLEGFHTKTPFLERIVLFFANHLTVSAQKNDVSYFIPSFYKEVIRANLHRGYASMLIASTKHPAMLKYLDNIRSSGPDSKRGKKKKVGLNENLAREILELHSVGLEANYTQADVQSLANILTGWSIPRNKKEYSQSSFYFRDQVHQPGVQKLMGRRYLQKGVRKGEQALSDLAMSPFTAKRLSYKLVQHFVSDKPDPTLVRKITEAYLKGGDDIIAMIKALVRAEESWDHTQRKLKLPHEYALSSLRMLRSSTLELRTKEKKQLMGHLMVMGQKIYSPPSPEGWSDQAEEWLSGESMLRRLRFAERMSAKQVSLHPNVEELANHTLGPMLTPKTRLMLQRAPSREIALALLLSAPEFQRR
jgi:uncharacterized protein (DUF1800 family)